MKDLIKNVQAHIQQYEKDLKSLRSKLKKLKPRQIKEMQDADKDIEKSCTDNADTATFARLIYLFDHDYCEFDDLYRADLVCVSLDFSYEIHVISFAIGGVTFEAEFLHDDDYKSIIPALKKISKIIA